MEQDKDGVIIVTDAKIDYINVDPIPTPTPIALFGKDHWSTFAYICQRVIDHDGIPNKQHMRCDPNIHPGHVNISPFGEVLDGGKYPTRLKFGQNVHGHDDWSCLEDFEAHGMLVNNGTGLNPKYMLTDLGWDCWHTLDRWIATHDSWSATFEWMPGDAK